MKPSVLIVDDHPLTRAGTRELLLGAWPGCQIGEARDLGEARRRLAERVWDLVLLDLSLPDGSGLELLPGCHFPVLVLTMHGDPGCLEAVRSAGAAIASKADSPESILKAIRALLPHPSAKRPSLSTRERQVLEHLLAGHPLSDLAQRLEVSPTSVQSYKTRLFAKLGVDSLPELVRTASRPPP